jgi:hypothetical protein
MFIRGDDAFKEKSDDSSCAVADFSYFDLALRFILWVVTHAKSTIEA